MLEEERIVYKIEAIVYDIPKAFEKALNLSQKQQLFGVETLVEYECVLYNTSVNE